MSGVDSSIDDLARRCNEETQKFLRRQVSDPHFCYELLRLALAEGVAEAFTQVYLTYEPQVVRWVYRHSRFVHTDESAEFFAQSAIRAFYFALRGPKFVQFHTLQQVLAYLRSCVHTTIMQYLRDQPPVESAPLHVVDEVAHTPDLEAPVAAAEVWSHICRVLPDERDRALARYVFLQELMPRHIVAADPARWGSEREVSVAIYRIRRILRNDSELCRRAGVELRRPPTRPSV